MSKSRRYRVILLVMILGISLACMGGTRPVPPTIPVDITNLDPKLGLHTDNAVGDKNYVVIMADFPNVQRQYSDDIMSQRLLEFVNKYYYEASYHRLNFKGTMTKHYMLPNPVEDYKIKPANLDVDPKKVISLVTDVVNAADPMWHSRKTYTWSSPWARPWMIMAWWDIAPCQVCWAFRRISPSPRTAARP